MRMKQKSNENQVAWYLSLCVLLGGIIATYVELGSGGQVFLGREKILTVADSKKMATILSQPAKLEKMLLTTVAKNPQDTHAWMWLARLYTQQKKWTLAEDCAHKAFDKSQSSASFLLWLHILSQYDVDKIAGLQDKIRAFAQKYPEHASYWRQFLSTS